MVPLVGGRCKIVLVPPWAVPATVVPIIEVLKHGNFIPSNLVKTGPGRLTLMDPVLHDVGLPQDDLARFLSVPSSETVFVAGAVVPGPPTPPAGPGGDLPRGGGPDGNDPVCWSCACSDSTSSAGCGVAG